MDTVYIDDLRISAGADYLKAVRSLGLEPDALFWAQDTIVDALVLVLVTRFFDYSGPLRLSELLFKAYNLEATPKEIDPFIVRLHSPNQSVIRDIEKALALRVTVRDFDEGTGSYGTPYLVQEKASVTVGVGDLHIPSRGIYRFKVRERLRPDVGRQWARFNNRIDALAA